MELALTHMGMRAYDRIPVIRYNSEYVLPVFFYNARLKVTKEWYKWSRDNPYYHSKNMVKYTYGIKRSDFKRKCKDYGS